MVPNCCGAIYGKLIRIKVCLNELQINSIDFQLCSFTQKPPHSGSDYYCYKGFHAMILLGWCDFRYRFIVTDTGSKGRQSDWGVFSSSSLSKKLKSNRMGLPPSKLIPSGPVLPHFLLGDEAFGLSSFMMTPYSGITYLKSLMK